MPSSHKFIRRTNFKLSCQYSRILKDIGSSSQCLNDSSFCLKEKFCYLSIYVKYIIMHDVYRVDEKFEEFSEIVMAAYVETGLSTFQLVCNVLEILCS